MTKPTLESLYRSFREEGDVSALSAVFDRVAPDLLRLARRLVRDRNQAQDLVQETFLTALERPGTYDPERPLRPWLVGILVHRARDERRRTGRPLDSDRLAPRAAATPPEAATASEFRDAVMKAVDQLPPKLRAVVQGRLVEERESGELAEELGLSPGALRVRWHRGLRRLRESLPVGLQSLAAGFGIRISGLAPTRERVLAEAARQVGTAGSASSLGATAGGGLSAAQLVLLAVSMIAVSVVVGFHYLGGDGTEAEAISAVDPGEKREAASAEVRAAELDDTRWEVETTPAAPVDRAIPGTVIVHVRSEGDGLADVVTFLEYEVQGETYLLEDVTDAAGTVRFTPPLGARVNWMEAGPTDECAPAREFVRRRLEAGSEHHVAFSLVRGRPLSGTVVDHEGNPVPDAEVVAWCESRLRGEPDRRTRSDERGEFAFAFLGPEFVLSAHTDELACTKGLRGEIEKDVVAEGLVVRLVPRTELRGVVRDPAARPVAGAEVEAIPDLYSHSTAYQTEVAGVATFRDGRGLTTTDGEGRFVFEGLPRGYHRLHVTRTPYLVHGNTYDTDRGEVEITLDPGLRLDGRVLDATGNPAVGARIRFGPYFGNVHTVPGDVTTDSEGKFALSSLLGEDADPSPFKNEPWLAVVHEGHAVEVVQPIRPGPDGGEFTEVRLQREHILAGRVVNETGSPVPGARVWIEGEREVQTSTKFGHRVTWEWKTDLSETVTDRDGAFRFPHLYPGPFLVHVYPPGDELVSLDVEAEAGDEDLEVVLDLRAMRKVVLTGAVCDALTGEPIPRFQVVPVVGEHGIWRSFDSPDGTFEIVGLEPGPIEVTVSAEGYADRYVPWRDYTNGEHRCDVTLSPRRSLFLSVVDEQGNPHDRGSVQVLNHAGALLEFGVRNARTFTAGIGNGKAIIHDLPAEIVTLRVDVDMFPRDFPVDLTQPIEGELQLVVAPRGRAQVMYLALVLEGDATEEDLRERLEPMSSFPADLFSLIDEGMISWPSSKLEVAFVDVVNDRERTLARATIEPRESGLFQTDVEYISASATYGSSGEMPFPLFDAELPEGKSTLRAVATGYTIAEQRLHLDADEAEEEIRFLILRRR